MYTTKEYTRTRIRQRSNMTYILAADVPYADIAFFVILALGLILGIIRGFSKSFKGFFLALAIMLASLLIITPTFEPVRNLEVFEKMDNSISTSIESKNQLFATPIYVTKEENGSLSYWVDTTVDGETRRVNLEEAANGDLTSSLKSKLALWLAKSFITEDGQTIGGVAGRFVSDLIVAIVMFVVYCLALWLICFILRKIFAGMRNSESSALKAIDRIFGAIVSTAFAFVFILLVLAILSSLRNKIPQVDEYLSNSTVCGYLYLKNPVAILFHKIFG